MRSNIRFAATVAVCALVPFFSASAASATEINIDTNNWFDHNATSLSASVPTETSITLSRTDGTLANTCTVSNFGVAVEFQGGTNAGGSMTSLSFSSCTRPITVHQKGLFFVDHTSGRNGTVTSRYAEITVSTPFGTVNCKTGEGTDLGTLTGTPDEVENHATLDLNAILNCGFLLSSAKLYGSYTFTSPTGLYVE